MFTDMVGYTVLMQEDEGRARAYRDRQRVVLEEQVAAHGGEIVQVYGDGTLSSFSSAVEATRAAVVIQQRLSESPRIPLRIGLHLGDVVHDDHGVVGDGVNVAARVQALAVPGSVMVSDRIHAELANHPALRHRSLGRFKLKNVFRDIEIFAIEAEGLVVPEPHALPRSQRAEGRSVAVLPFVNMSADPDNEFFADGITEEILNALTRIEGLQVTARTSSFAFKGLNRDVRDIASELGVATVLEGSVRQAGNRVRITAQLVEAATGYHLFSEVYDSSLDDIFATQDEISQAIMERLEAQFGMRGAEPAAPPPAHGHVHTQDPEAFKAYLKGRFHWQKWTREDSVLALQYLEQSAELDPSCALPFSALANLYTFLGSVGQVPPSDAYPRAAAFARHALELEPGAGEGELALGAVKMFYDWDFEGAEENLTQAIERIPGSADARNAYALLLKIVGRHQQAIEQSEMAVRLDPLSLPMNRALAVALLSGGRIEEAEEQIRRVITLDNSFRPGFQTAGWIRLAHGDVVGALTIWERLAEMSDDGLGTAIGVRGLAYGKLGRLDEAHAMLELLEKRQADTPLVALHNDFALVHWGLGNLDETFRHLGEAVDARLGSVVFLATSPNWAPLRDDVRFQALVERIGLPPQADTSTL
jgi:TolB-like protein/tetratricopeptide (TPR) repeat protein